MVPGQIEELNFTAPDINHTFRRNHRIMVQVQSTWFPVYDRNPQKFVPNIFEAHAEDYVKAVERVYRGAATPSAVVLPVVSGAIPAHR